MSLAAVANFERLVDRLGPVMALALALGLAPFAAMALLGARSAGGRIGPSVRPSRRPQPHPDKIHLNAA